ncbi:MAG: hypothetical protein ACOYD6_07090 [Limnochordia bacterium]|jgi:hypothetical protein
MFNHKLVGRRYRLEGRRVGPLELAWDLRLQRHVLLLRGRDLEARVGQLSPLGHPHLLQVLDYIPGAMVFERAVPQRPDGKLIPQIAALLSFLHRRGITHGAISWEHILMGPQGQLKVIPGPGGVTPQEDLKALAAMARSLPPKDRWEEHTWPYRIGGPFRSLGNLGLALSLALLAALLLGDGHPLWIPVLIFGAGWSSPPLALGLLLPLALWLLYSVAPGNAFLLGSLLFLVFPWLIRYHRQVLLLCLCPVVKPLGLIFLPPWRGGHRWGPWSGLVIGCGGYLFTLCLAPLNPWLEPGGEGWLIPALLLGVSGALMGWRRIYPWNLILIAGGFTFWGLLGSHGVNPFQVLLSLGCWLLIEHMGPTIDKGDDFAFDLPY